MASAGCDSSYPFQRECRTEAFQGCCDGGSPMSGRSASRVRGPRDLARLSESQREVFFNSAEAIAEARRRGTTVAAEVERLRARGVRVSRASVRRFFGHDLERGPGGWAVAKPSDRSYHGDLRIVSTEGLVERPVRGSNARRLVSAHANSVQRYLRGGDPDGEGLARFRGRRAGGVELETDRDRLDELQRRGEFDDFDLYADRGV